MAEREVVRALGGDCTMPLAAHAFVEDDRVRLLARLGDEAGALIDAEATGAVGDAQRLGREAADRLLERGGRELLARLNPSRS
jgi:hydroxymethylbilane synthase